MTATASSWSLISETIDIENGCLVGVLNVTPDSFSDAGEYLDPVAAVAHGLAMTEQGASVVDVGGESTRPGAEPVSDHVELSRVMPVVSGLIAQGVRVSIDTQKPGVAESALDAGAVIVNDVGGFEDEGMMDLVADRRCGVMIVHKQGTAAERYADTRYDDVVGEVEEYLLDRAQRLVDAGVDRARVAIDPGIGFGKRAADSLALLGNLDRLTRHGLPVVVGASRKGFIGKVIGADSREGRDTATATITALTYTLGARVFRVHHVPKSRDALRLAAAIVASEQWDGWLQG
ncbi:MAG: dihydropteroate synthase [Acidimicrobiia bacterium]